MDKTGKDYSGLLYSGELAQSFKVYLNLNKIFIGNQLCMSCGLAIVLSLKDVCFTNLNVRACD